MSPVNTVIGQWIVSKLQRTWEVLGQFSVQFHNNQLTVTTKSGLYVHNNSTFQRIACGIAGCVRPIHHNGVLHELQSTLEQRLLRRDLVELALALGTRHSKKMTKRELVIPIVGMLQNPIFSSQLVCGQIRQAIE
ncbi:MAG: hypothetical protein GY820_30595 [Gammaproteobacteria bacterium]|nr:hypothetical protein [Gammaproteobacteria bacterium]